MNPHDEQQLEAAVNRELKTLPTLRAPASLAARVMAEIERRQALPWYRRAWLTWPMPLRAVSFAGLLAAFGALCYGSWALVQSPAVMTASRTVGGWLASLGAIWKAGAVLVAAAGHALQSLGPITLICGGMMLVASYALCVGLGTVYVRLALRVPASVR
jgi:hypothetical protein